MIEVEVVSQKNVGDLCAVTVRLTMPEKHSIDEVDVGELDRAGEYHRSLHDNRVLHRHNHMTDTQTVFIEAPFTQEKLDAALEGAKARMELASIDDFRTDYSVAQERMFINGRDEKKFYTADECPQEIKDRLLAAFPGLDFSSIGLVSAPSWHSATMQTVVSAFLHENDRPCLMEGDVPLIAKARKYCLESGLYYDRCYAFAETHPDFIPESCTVLSISFHVNVPEALHLPEFYDVYFSGDPATVEEAFNLPPLTGNHSTYYGVTVVDGHIVRAKQYCYDHATVFSNWDKTVVTVAADHGVSGQGV